MSLVQKLEFLMLMVTVIITNEINSWRRAPPKLSCTISDSGRITKFEDHGGICSPYAYDFLIRKFEPDWKGWKSNLIEIQHNNAHIGLYVPKERYNTFDEKAKKFLLRNSTRRPSGINLIDPSVNIDYILRLIILQSLDLPKDFSWECFLKEFKRTVGIDT